MTNYNFLVTDEGERFVVRVGDDIPVHGIMRFNELAAARAAYAAGLAPEVVHHEPGVMVTRYVEGRPLDRHDLHSPRMLERLAALLRRCHNDAARHLRGPILMFWVFHVLRSYAAVLRDSDSRRGAEVTRLMPLVQEMEAAIGPVDIVFAHNDMLAANFIADGDRLWLIDWEYAGFNSPLFDLAGLCAVNQVPRHLERAFLESYFHRPADARLWRAYMAMRCAAMLREAMWSMVAEVHSTLDVDFAAYTDKNLARFDQVLDEYRELG